VYERDVKMTSFWQNDNIVWEEGIKEMHLVMKDNSGGRGHAHKRPDPEKFFPTKMRITMIQVAKGSTYDPKLVPNLPEKKVIPLTQLGTLPRRACHRHPYAEAFSYSSRRRHLVKLLARGHARSLAISLTTTNRSPNGPASVNTSNRAYNLLRSDRPSADLRTGCRERDLN